MKSLFKGTIVALGFSALMFASISADQAGQGAAGQKPAPPHDMTGCLTKGAMPGQYQLTNVEGKVTTVDILEVDKEVKGIDAHLGHRVTITGTAVAKPADGKGMHYMRITAFKHVAPTCP
jgi:hypothetical protein